MELHPHLPLMLKSAFNFMSFILFLFNTLCKSSLPLYSQFCELVIFRIYTVLIYIQDLQKQHYTAQCYGSKKKKKVRRVEKVIKKCVARFLSVCDALFFFMPSLVTELLGCHSFDSSVAVLPRSVQHCIDGSLAARVECPVPLTERMSFCHAHAKSKKSSSWKPCIYVKAAHVSPVHASSAVVFPVISFPGKQLWNKCRSEGKKQTWSEVARV